MERGGTLCDHMEYSQHRCKRTYYAHFVLHHAIQGFTTYSKLNPSLKLSLRSQKLSEGSFRRLCIIQSRRYFKYIPLTSKHRQYGSRPYLTTSCTVWYPLAQSFPFHKYIRVTTNQRISNSENRSQCLYMPSNFSINLHRYTVFMFPDIGKLFMCGGPPP